MSTRRIDILIAAGFAVLLLANIAHHEMWRDETLAWMIVRTAHSPAGLFAALHYDGHPGLWHLLLWPATWVTTDPVAIKVVHAPIGLAIIGLVALASPFSRLERVLILGGYYLGFEYLVISRNYAIGILLALLHAQARVRAPDKVLLNSALLALMANTNVYAAIFSGVLALDYARERVVAGMALRRIIPGGALYVAGLLIALATVWPAADMSREITNPLAQAYNFSLFVYSFIYFAATGLVSVIWPPNDIIGDAAVLPYVVVAVALTVTVVQVFRPRPWLAAVFLTTLAATTLFGHLVYTASYRHFGITTIAFLTCLWIARGQGAAPSRIGQVLLALGFLGGAPAVITHWQEPFSMGGATARWIAASEYAARPLFGWPDAHTATVAAFLDRDIAMPQCGCVGPRAVFDRARDGFRREDLPVAVNRMMTAPSLLLMVADLSPEEITAFAGQGILVRLVQSQIAAWSDESYRIYTLDRVMPPATSTPSRS